jgi:hypothetical protein
MYWQRFALKDIPLESTEKFDAWIQKRWAEKDALLEQYLTTGRFPANAEETGGIAFTGERRPEYIETEVKLRRWYEVGSLYVVVATVALLANAVAKVWDRVLHAK